MDLRKTMPDGGRWFGECPPIANLTPILEPLTADQAAFDYQEACKVRTHIQDAEPDPLISRDEWYSGSDPEWCAWIFDDYGIDPDPGPILRPVIEQIRAARGCTRGQAAAELVRMDTVTELVDQIVKWAVRERLQASKAHRRCEPPDLDVVAIGFGLPAFCLEGVDRCMDVIAAEKAWHEDDMERRGMVEGWRPEKVAELRAGLGASVTTAYREGCPAMGPRPQGHSAFFAFVCQRAADFLNGPKVDQTLATTALHGGFFRVFAFMHSVREGMEGNDIGRRSALGHFDDYHGGEQR